MNIFIRGIEALPNDVLRSSVLAKYALAEKSRHRLLLAAWDLESTKRQVKALEKVQDHLENTHCLDESEYKFWLQMYTDRGLPDLKDDELFYGDQLPSAAQEADRDASELTVMVDQSRARGLNVNTLDDESGGSDENGLERGCGKGRGISGDRVMMKHGIRKDCDEHFAD